MPNPALLNDALAPDLVALFLGATPHPDIVIPEPQVTIADLAAIARAQSAQKAQNAQSTQSGQSGQDHRDPDGGAAAPVLRWDAAGQRFAS